MVKGPQCFASSSDDIWIYPPDIKPCTTIGVFFAFTLRYPDNKKNGENIYQFPQTFVKMKSLKKALWHHKEIQNFFCEKYFMKKISHNLAIC